MKLKILNLFLLIISIFITGCSSLKNVDHSEKISKNFTMKEAVRPGVKIDKDTHKNIKYTAKRMEEVRKHLGTEVHVISWYRDPDHNKKSGGAKKSAHLEALAVDFKTKDSAWANYQKIIKSKLSYDLVIYYPKQGFVHVGFKKDKDEEKKMQMIQ